MFHLLLLQNNQQNPSEVTKVQSRALLCRHGVTKALFMVIYLFIVVYLCKANLGRPKK